MIKLVKLNYLHRSEQRGTESLNAPHRQDD